jgi:hypothetical protein
MSKPECICPSIPKKRGRPVGSKNKPKVVVNTNNTGNSCTFKTGSECTFIADGVPVVLEPETAETVPLVPTVPNADGTTCEDCNEYLTCNKIKNLDSLPPTCKEFFNNFIVDNDTETEELLKEVESI